MKKKLGKVFLLQLRHNVDKLYDALVNEVMPTDPVEFAQLIDSMHKVIDEVTKPTEPSHGIQV
jgi:hypothetical protein